MARLPETFIQQVLQATDIVELVSQYVALKQKGREYVGLCPFHADKNPSMYVTPVKQIFKCFVCGAGGSPVNFLMLYDKLSFPEAIRTLAERANIPLPQDFSQPAGPPGMSKNDLIGATEFATRFFREQLYASGGADALAYVHRRGMTDESIEQFGVGFAPESWDAFLQAASRKGFTQEQLVAAGLVRRRDRSSGCYDYFRNRLMFPIHDVAGRAVAFGGRALAADEKAKYLNSPESILFDKSSLVYGLHFARKGMVTRKQAVVVEGYFDVLMPLQAGVDNVVATLGTALTERHVRLLTRYVQEAVLLFDADTAGQAAAERALPHFLAQKLHVRIAEIPAGKDPCDFVLSDGGDAMRTLVDDAPDALTYVWQKRYQAFQEAGGKPAQQNRVVDDFLQLIVSSSVYGAIDETRRSNLVQHIAHIINVPAIDLQQQMRRLRRTTPQPRRTPVQRSVPATSVPARATNPATNPVKNQPAVASKGPSAAGPGGPTLADVPMEMVEGGADSVDIPEGFAPVGATSPVAAGGGATHLPAAPASAGTASAAERIVLEVLLDCPDLFDDAAERVDPSFFHDAMFHAIAEQIWKAGHAETLSIDGLLAQENMTHFAPILTEMAMTAQQRIDSILPTGEDETSKQAEDRTSLQRDRQAQLLADAIRWLLDRDHRSEVQQLKQNLADADGLRALADRLATDAKVTNRVRRPRIQE